MTESPDPMKASLLTAVRKGFQFALVLLGVTGIAALLYGSLTGAKPGGGFQATVRFFSYFTIQSGLSAVVFSFISAVRRMPRTPESSQAGRFEAPFQLSFLVAVVLTAGGYFGLLADKWAPQGLQAFGDLLLHAVVPAMLVLDWLLFAPKGRMEFSHVPFVLFLPLAHLGVVAVLHGWLGGYPYFFLDPTKTGDGAFLRNVVIFAVLFLLAGALVVLVDRLIGRRKPRGC